MSDDEGDDPFACFDSDDDDESDAGQAKVVNQEIMREPSNGVLAFHTGTEIAMLHHVKSELAKKQEPNTQLSGIEATIDRAQTLLEIVDKYCLSRHWMMHVGPEKAGPLQKFIEKALQEHQDNNSQQPFCIVELGTYCGYSSVFIAKTILEHSLKHGKSTEVTSETTGDRFSFHIYSVEVVEKFAQVARELIQLAGMEKHVSLLLVKDPDAIAAAIRRGEEDRYSLSSELLRRLPETKTKIDFLFVDHDKSLYLHNLQELEHTGMIQRGTHVAADNVVFAQIRDYREYMTNLAAKGIVSTRLEDSLFVEYCQPELGELEERTEKNAKTKDMMRDGIEFSVYLKDPLKL